MRLMNSNHINDFINPLITVKGAMFDSISFPIHVKPTLSKTLTGQIHWPAVPYLYRPNSISLFDFGMYYNVSYRLLNAKSSFKLS